MVVATILSVRRMRNSDSGNPVWELSTTNGVFRTNPNSNVGHVAFDEMIGQSVVLHIHNGKVFAVV